MAIVEQLIRSESDDTLSFGNYQLPEKAKVEDFPFQGNSYKVKTFSGITRLEKDGMFAYESVPGTAVLGLKATEAGVQFKVEGTEDAQVTLELEEETEYEITIDGTSAGVMKTNLGGKLSMSVELADADSVAIKVEKK